LLQNSLPPRTAKATQSARRTIRTRWPKPTRLSPTSVSNSCAQAQNYPRGRSDDFGRGPFLHFAGDVEELKCWGMLKCRDDASVVEVLGMLLDGLARSRNLFLGVFYVNNDEKIELFT